MESSHPSGSTLLPEWWKMSNPSIFKQSRAEIFAHCGNKLIFLVVKIRSTFCASTVYCRKQWDIFSYSSNTANINCLNHSNRLCVYEISRTKKDPMRCLWLVACWVGVSKERSSLLISVIIDDIRHWSFARLLFPCTLWTSVTSPFFSPPALPLVGWLVICPLFLKTIMFYKS